MDENLFAKIPSILFYESVLDDNEEKSNCIKDNSILSNIRDSKVVLILYNLYVRTNYLNECDTSVSKLINVCGGDTGADCVGTSVRQGAKSVYQIEVLSKPSKDRPLENPWPNYPQILRVSTSHEEAAVCLGGTCRTELDVREWEVNTKEFIGDENGNLKQMVFAKVEWVEENGRRIMKEIPNSEFKVDVDLAFLAIGFVHPEHEGLINGLGLELDPRGNVKATERDYKTSKEKFFAAGDMRRGQSLIVWAISEGRKCAESVDKYLMGK